MERLQADEDTLLREGDIINLDDTHIAHPYAKKLPFLCWLFDSSSKVYSWCMSAVVIQAVLRNGLEYPLLYSYWRKIDDDTGLTKYELAQQLLLMLRQSVTCRLWVAMDRWYLKKEFMMFLETHTFDWVTKAKRNTALYRKISQAGRKDRYVPISARQLIKETYDLLPGFPVLHNEELLKTQQYQGIRGFPSLISNCYVYKLITSQLSSVYAGFRCSRYVFPGIQD